MYKTYNLMGKDLIKGSTLQIDLMKKTDAIIGAFSAATDDPRIQKSTNSPLNQFKLGIEPKDMYCSVGKQLYYRDIDTDETDVKITRYICIKPITASILIERDWQLQSVESESYS